MESRSFHSSLDAAAGTLVEIDDELGLGLRRALWSREAIGGGHAAPVGVQESRLGECLSMARSLRCTFMWPPSAWADRNSRPQKLHEYDLGGHTQLPKSPAESLANACSSHDSASYEELTPSGGIRELRNGISFRFLLVIIQYLACSMAGSVLGGRRGELTGYRSEAGGELLMWMRANGILLEQSISVSKLGQKTKTSSYRWRDKLEQPPPAGRVRPPYIISWSYFYFGCCTFFTVHCFWVQNTEV